VDGVALLERVAEGDLVPDSVTVDEVVWLGDTVPDEVIDGDKVEEEEADGVDDIE
jgi:hypothetical protein